MVSNKHKTKECFEEIEKDLEEIEDIIEDNNEIIISKQKKKKNVISKKGEKDIEIKKYCNKENSIMFKF